MASASQLWNRFSKAWPAATVLEIRNFRLMWIGAFLSFFGSQIQFVAQGDYVWRLTHDKALLSYVGVAGMIPGTFLFPFVGFIVDYVDKRILMTICMIVMAIGSLLLGIGMQIGVAPYWLFIVVSLVTGIFGTVEMPARQSLIREAVPLSEIPKAIPMQAMTFNLARVIGPAVGGLLLSWVGASVCFFVNAVSFLGLIWAPWTMKLEPSQKMPEHGSIRDIVFEGVVYTLRHRSLRTHFLLESATSFLAVFYINQLPAYVDQVLRLGPRELGYAQSAIGIGAISGLITIGALSERAIRPFIIRCAMTLVSTSLLLLAFVPHPFVVMIALMMAGFGTISQFNSTNALFQVTAPERLKGRVLTMHFWALAGLAPVGLAIFGHLAEVYRLSTALTVGGGLLALVTIWAWTMAYERNDPTPETV